MEPHRYTRYVWESQMVTVNGRYRADCNTIVFWNQGLSVVTIDSAITLDPPNPGIGKEGVAYTFEGYPGEMNVHTYDIVFAAGGQNKLVITRKVYQDNDQ